MTNNIEIKKILEDVIIYTYKDKVPLNIYEKLMRFQIHLDNKILNSYHGIYKYTGHSITIVNLYRSSTQIICTTIHELSHHVDYILRSKSDHSKEFYNVFAQLLYTSLNMGLFSKEDALKMQTDASDSQKIKKIVDKYIPQPISYKKEEKKIIVYNGYTIKKILKEYGFFFNSLTTNWEKNIPVNQLPELKIKLEKLSCDFDIVDSGTLNVEANGILLAVSKDSYNYKEELKSNGFRWNPELKRWQKKIKMSDYDKEMIKLRHLNDKIPIALEKKKKKK
jgi:hypothetical protein